MEKKSKSTPIEVDVLEDNSLDKTINTELVKNNVTDQVIAELKNQYGGLKLRDIEDKEMYLEIKIAQKNTRKVGILVEKLCRKGREDAIAIQRKWLAKEKSVLAQIAEVEDPLQAEIDRFDANVERKEQEAANRREEAYMKRQQQLLRMGAAYENGSFVLNHISYETTLVKESDEDIWTETILPKYQREYEKNEAERFEIEKKREQEAAEFKKQQAEMDRQRKELEEQQKQFRDQQEQATKIIQEQKRQKLIARGNQLAALGMTFNFQYDAYVYEDVNVDNKTELCLWSDQEWDDVIKKITPIIEERKQAAEEKKRKKIEDDIAIAKEEAARKERERIESEQREAKKKEEYETQRKAEEAERATDKVKWQSFVAHINSKPFPEMKNSTYKYKVTEAGKLIDKINNL